MIHSVDIPPFDGVSGPMAKKTCDRKNERGRTRHTRAIQRDRSKRPVTPPPDEKIEQRLSKLLEPAIEAQAVCAKALGLRSRLLPLSVMWSS